MHLRKSLWIVLVIIVVTISVMEIGVPATVTVAGVISGVLLLKAEKIRLWKWWQYILLAAVIGSGVYYTGAIARHIITNIAEPPLWDVQALWLYGRVAANGQNFHSPDMFHLVAEHYQMTENNDFKVEILDRGSQYPPPSIWVFLPLGWFELHTGIVIWYVIQIAATGLVLWLLLKDYFFLSETQAGWVVGLVVLVLIVGMHPLRVNFGRGQTMIMWLVCFMLFNAKRTQFWGGFWLALCILIKLPALILIPYLILRRQWKALAGTTVTLAGVTVITAVAFGIEPFMSYIFQNPNVDVPSYLFTEGVKQSLLSTVLRVTEADTTHGVSLLYPYFLIAALPISAITGGILLLKRRFADEYAVLVCMMFAMMIYPVTLDLYSLVLLLPIGLLWRDRTFFPGQVWGLVALLGAIYVLAWIQPFVANLLMWFVLLIQGFAAGKTRPEVQVNSPQAELLAAEMAAH
ncbi:MAG: DUF2029 domain-containing protein [Anaerolineae bacterium]|nr:DUF2029 domain-containing protein [Anaerolineae bacterium]